MEKLTILNVLFLLAVGFNQIQANDSLSIVGKTYKVVKIEKGKPWSNAELIYSDIQLTFKEDHVLEIINLKNNDTINGTFLSYPVDSSLTIILTFGVMINNIMTIVNDHFECSIIDSGLLFSSIFNNEKRTLIFLEEEGK